MKSTLRENLLVTFGARAAVMDALGHITLPSGSAGEDTLADLAVQICDQWLSREDDDLISFDEFIETALLDAFRAESGHEWFGTVRWCEADIRAALIDDGYEPTEDAITSIRYRMENHCFTDYQIERGWDLIHQYISDESKNLEPMEEY